jgi:4-amino-4-deoxy-L-arabinose transferase-like glycosyltransferase
MSNPSDVNPRPRRLALIAAFGLIAIMAGQVVFSVRSESQTWDEAYHLLAGYRYWQNSDFGINPEHPPLVKWVAALPLLFHAAPVPHIPQGTSKSEGFVAARQFLFSQDAEALLFRSRLATSLFMLLLALLVFEAAYRMFGPGPAVLALALLAFEPNLLAHAALINTDVGMAGCWLASIYSFYRYVRSPSLLKLAECGMVTGITLAVKHSGVLVFPALILLSLIEILATPHAVQDTRKTRGLFQETLRFAAVLLAIGAISVVVLWACYGFRYSARPDGLTMTPPLADYIQGAGGSMGLRNPVLTGLILRLGHSRLLPESYLYGLADVLIVAAGPRPMFLLGRLFSHGRWFYFPAVFVIKSTLGLIVLLLAVLFAKTLHPPRLRRAALFLLVPAVFYFLTSLASGLNVGVRHILPVYPLLIILVAAGAWELAQHRRRWAYVVGALAVFHAVSSLRAFPDYLAYSNEIWGGPARTFLVLSDSNVDYGQGLVAASKYLRREGTTECWLAYFGSADPAFYHNPCKLLQDAFTPWWGQPVEVIPEIYEGTLLISASQMAGVYSGPGELNPFGQFLRIPPAANIGGSILVFKGRFDMSLASQWSRLNKAWQLLGNRQMGQALTEARAALVLAPRTVYAHYTLGFLLDQTGEKAEARREYQMALSLAQSIHPEYQWFWVPFLQQQLNAP